MSKQEEKAERKDQITWISTSDPKLYHTFMNGFRVQSRFGLDEQNKATRVVSVFYDYRDGATLSLAGTSHGEIDALTISLTKRLKQLLGAAQEETSKKATGKETEQCHKSPAK